MNKINIIILFLLAGIFNGCQHHLPKSSYETQAKSYPYSLDALANRYQIKRH